jgi:hypothetical protein
VFLQTEPILEYQVHQTASGISVDFIADAPIRIASLEASLSAALHGVGLKDAAVTVQQVDHIARHADTGKLKRFVPL